MISVSSGSPASSTCADNARPRLRRCGRHGASSNRRSAASAEQARSSLRLEPEICRTAVPAWAWPTVRTWLWRGLSPGRGAARTPRSRTDHPICSCPRTPGRPHERTVRGVGGSEVVAGPDSVVAAIDGGSTRRRSWSGQRVARTTLAGVVASSAAVSTSEVGRARVVVMFGRCCSRCVS